MKVHDLVKNCHVEWQDIISQALAAMDANYLQQLIRENNYLPQREQLFAAFSLPLSQTKYILLGESPYPRAESANGYAFWDNAVGSLWAKDGLSKAVNRATSLRNLIKTLLVARGDLVSDLSQPKIASLNKSHLVQTAADLFKGMMQHGILLLNASLVYSDGQVRYHARHWQPFMKSLLEQIAARKPDVQMILFGKIAEAVPQDQLKVGLRAEHPYNVSFISNNQVLDFFKPLDLLNESI